MTSLVHRITRAPLALLRRTHPFVPVLHRYMVLQLIRRDILSRYQGSIIGLGWTLLYPLLILGAYTFVFRTVFKARWPGGGDSTAEFALQVFAGLVVFNLFGELLGRAPKLVLEQPNLVKRVVFPLEILAWVAVGTAMFHAVLAIAVLLAALLWVGSGLTAWVLLIPVVLGACVPVMLGLAWLLAGFGVFIRDIGHAVGPAVSMLLFLSPVLYPTKALPGFLADLLWLNPLTLPIENLRRIVIEGTAPDWSGLAVYTLCGLVFAFIAHRLFERLRPAFADEV
jgi:lipopolysaccharide transport system permease protein